MNADKCKVLCVSYGVPRSLTVPPVQVGGTRLQRVTELVSLGVIFDQHLTFEAQARATSNKAKAVMAVLHRSVGKSIGERRMLRLYKTCAEPVFNYCITAAPPREERGAEVLRKAQKHCMRCISGRFDLRTTVLAERLSISSQEAIRKQHLLLFAYKIFKGIHFVPSQLFRIRSEEAAPADDSIGARRAASATFKWEFVPPTIGSTAKAYDHSVVMRAGAAWNELRGMTVGKGKHPGI